MMTVDLEDHANQFAQTLARFQIRLFWIPPLLEQLQTDIPESLSFLLFLKSKDKALKEIRRKFFDKAVTNLWWCLLEVAQQTIPNVLQRHVFVLEKISIKSWPLSGNNRLAS